MTLSEETLDVGAILAEVGMRGPARTTLATGGVDTTVWRVEHGDETYALRLFRPDQAAVAKCEIAAMGAAGAHGLPAPVVHREGVWHERPVLLLSWMPGRTLKEEVCARPWQAWALGMAFGRAQARFHRIAAPDALLDGSRSWIDWAVPDDALRSRLEAVASDSMTLLHLDYHPLNVLVDAKRVSAILDWTNARAGDRRADLARTASILRFAPICDGLPAPILSVVRRGLEAGWRHGYRDVTGPVSGMAPFYAWAGTLMVRDLSPRLGRPDLPWLTPAFLERVQAWADEWQAACRRL